MPSDYYDDSRYTHEGATRKFNNVVRRMGWDQTTSSSFHAWLGRYYGDKKDYLSEQELYDLAQEFQSEQ